MRAGAAYKMYSPGGNITALVDGPEPDAGRRREIQDSIIKKHACVEQVGFVYRDGCVACLDMAGGEFCGNAARAAAWHMLGGRPGAVLLRVSGASGLISAGVGDALEAWAEIPMETCRVTKSVVASDYCPGATSGGAWFVEMEGISHLVLSAAASAPFLDGFYAAGDASALLRGASRLLDAYFASRFPINYDSGPATGVVFSDESNGAMKIHPCVFVKQSGTAFYETACGSGSAAAVAVRCVINGKSASVSVLQPSGSAIETSVAYDNGVFGRARISGEISELHDI